MTSHNNCIGLDYKGEWREEDFSNFWEHYNVAQKWIGIEANAREKAWKHWKNGCVNNQTSQSSKHVQENHSLSDDQSSDICPEMIDFLRKTIDHRKQRDKLRKHDEEATISSPRNKRLEYRDATADRSNKVHRVNQKKTLYGEPAFLKLKEHELSIQEKFENQLKENKPQTWPNIPMRF